MANPRKASAPARSGGTSTSTTKPKVTKAATMGHSDLTKAVRGNLASIANKVQLPARVRDKIVSQMLDEPVDPRLELRDRIFGIDTIEDAFRQTGRTTQMLESAASLARSGTPVLIIMKDEARVDQVLNTAKFYANTQVNVRSHNPKLPLFDWSTLEPIVPEYQGWKVFVDHDVAYAYNRQILNLLGWVNLDEKTADE